MHAESSISFFDNSVVMFRFLRKCTMLVLISCKKPVMICWHSSILTAEICISTISLTQSLALFWKPLLELLDFVVTSASCFLKCSFLLSSGGINSFAF